MHRRLVRLVIGESGFNKFSNDRFQIVFIDTVERGDNTRVNI